MQTRALVTMFGMLVLLFGAGNLPAGADPLKTKPFVYTQDFEESNPFVFWTSDGKYTVNFEGLTEEKAFAGKKSFKLDVTFQEGSYFYWKIPLKVPAEGKLNLSARIFLGKETTGRAGLGANFQFPPTTYSGCGASQYFTTTSNEWQSIEDELVKGPNGVVSKYILGVTGDDFGTYLDLVGPFLEGKAGDRVVLYVDDIRINGEVPGEEDYQKEINRRWDLAKERIHKKISGWNQTLAEAGQTLAALTNLSADAGKMKAELGQKVAGLKEKVAVVEKRGYIIPEEKDLDPAIEQLKAAIPNFKAGIQSASGGKSADQGYVLYVVSPVTKFKILPSDTAFPGSVSDEIFLAACPGEYEPGSFVMHALNDINSLEVKPSALKCETGNNWLKIFAAKTLIPAGNVDVKVVKCWYQADTAWEGIDPKDKNKKILIPELLLNNDSLVKVDYAKQENYLKLSYPDGAKYVWISDPNEKRKKDDTSLENFPVKDSPVLLPVDIPAQANKQFWVTVKVPGDAKPGMYNGTLTLSSAGKELGAVKLQLRVLPFKLEAPYPIQAIYYRGTLRADGKGSVSSEEKTEEQFRYELRNMLAHGVNNPAIYQSFSSTNSELLAKVLKIRQEEGMAGRPIYLAANTVTNSSPEKLEALKKRVVDAITLATNYGVTEVGFMGADEAGGERLKAQRPAWTAVHQAGGKVWVAGREESFKVMGDIQDHQNLSMYPKKEYADEWHSIGHKICSYGNPFSGVENPELPRRNFGLLLWKLGYDGAFNYAYQHSAGHGWNDFDSTMRDLNYTYPTVNGVINTIAWEGYREGVDDVRYAKTLQKAIDRGKKSKNAETSRLADEADKYLQNLDVELRNLDTIRLEMVDYILKLEGGK